MELRDFIKIVKKHSKKIALFLVIGFVAGLVFNFYPPKYISSGSLYVKRTTDIQKGYFAYEGYYAQQSALLYTNSVVALLESPDIKKKVLEIMGLSPNEENIRKLGREITVKKTGPQVILVSVRDSNYDSSVGIWDKTVNSLIEISTQINKGGDENLGLSLISERPAIKQAYRSPYLFGIAGSLISLTFFLVYICIKDYLIKD